MRQSGPGVWRGGAKAILAACVSAVIAVFPATASATTASWTIVPSPNPGVLGELLDVTCVGASDCWAVGGSQDYLQTLIEHNAGSGWVIVPSPKPTDGDTPRLYGVTCISASDCWAVGWYINRVISTYATLTDHYDGSNWTIIPSPNPGLYNELVSVKCVNANDCWAVGEYSTASARQQLIEQYTGGSWVVVAPGLSTGSLTDVACLSLLGDCWAVGKYGMCPNGPPGSTVCTLIEHNPGNGWVIVPSPVVTNSALAYLDGVTCVTSSDCWAVGWYIDTANNWPSLTEHYDGSSWTIVLSPNIGNLSYVDRLTDVSCASASDCWAVGYAAVFRDGGRVESTLIEHNTGSGWVVASQSPKGSQLNGIKCVSSRDCWAVGTYSLGTLVVHHK